MIFVLRNFITVTTISLRLFTVLIDSRHFSGGTQLNRPVVLCFFLLSFILMSMNVQAAIGLPESTAKIGFSFGAARLHVDDPVGDSEAVYAVQPLKVMYSEWLSGGYRTWFESYYQEASLSADEVHIGQYFQQSGIHFSVQKNIDVARYFKPWFGLGIDLSLGRYTQRHTKDDEGYLLESFSNRLEPTGGLLLYFVSEWQLSKEWSMGGNFLQRISLNQAVTQSSFSLFFLTRY